MTNPDNLNIIALAAEAQRLGYDTPGKVIAGLEYNIRRNIDYLNKPNRRGKSLKFHEEVEERNKILAMAIVLIESLDDGRDSR